MHNGFTGLNDGFTGLNAGLEINMLNPAFHTTDIVWNLGLTPKIPCPAKYVFQPTNKNHNVQNYTIQRQIRLDHLSPDICQTDELILSEVNKWWEDWKKNPRDGAWMEGMEAKFTEGR